MFTKITLVRGLIHEDPRTFEVPRSLLYVPRTVHWTWRSSGLQGLTVIAPSGTGIDREWIYLAAMMRVDDSLFEAVYRKRPVWDPV
jgi:hypothetical protein